MDEKVWFSFGFVRFSSSSGKNDAGSYSSVQFITFYCQTDTLGAISSPRKARRSSPELRNYYFLLSKQCAGSHFQPKAPRSSPELRNDYFSLSKRCAGSLFEPKAPRCPLGLPNHHFSLSKRCAVRHFDPKTFVCSFPSYYFCFSALSLRFRLKQHRPDPFRSLLQAEGGRGEANLPPGSPKVRNQFA